MNLAEIQLEMTFDAGHRIVGHKGKCARLHGHTYRIVVRATGVIRDPGFVVDFGDIKDFINQWDHKMLLFNTDPLIEEWDWTIQSMIANGVETLPFNPTAENMAQYLAREMGRKFQLLDCAVTLWETPKACATSIFQQDRTEL